MIEREPLWHGIDSGCGGDPSQLATPGIKAGKNSAHEYVRRLAEAEVGDTFDLEKELDDISGYVSDMLGAPSQGTSEFAPQKH